MSDYGQVGFWSEVGTETFDIGGIDGVEEGLDEGFDGLDFGGVFDLGHGRGYCCYGSGDGLQFLVRRGCERGICTAVV